jgi:hypothetical protein
MDMAGQSSRCGVVVTAKQFSVFIAPLDLVAAAPPNHCLQIVGLYYQSVS